MGKEIVYLVLHKTGCNHLYQKQNKSRVNLQKWRLIPLLDVTYKFESPGPEVIKLFSYSTQLSTKIILLIIVKIPTMVGILTLISMINTTSKRLKARHFFICRYFSFYEQLKFRAKLS